MPTAAPTSVYPTPTVAPSLDTAIVDAINRERKVRGLSPLLIDPALTAIARQHNGWMSDNNCFDHNCPGEETVWQRLARAGYPNFAGSEVIARGYDTPENLVMNGWLMSDGHRAILLGNYNRIGCSWDEFDSGYMGRFQTCDLGIMTGGNSPTATPATGLPRGWVMVIELPYNTVPYDVVNRAYNDFCVGLSRYGVRCTWRRTTP